MTAAVHMLHDMKAMSDDELKAQFTAEHGEVHVLKIGPTRVVVRLPKDEEYDRWRDELEKEKGKKPLAATEKIFRQCCLWPAREEIRRGFALTFGNCVLELYGVIDSDKVEKA